MGICNRRNKNEITIYLSSISVPCAGENNLILQLSKHGFLKHSRPKDGKENNIKPNNKASSSRLTCLYANAISQSLLMRANELKENQKWRGGRRRAQNHFSLRLNFHFPKAKSILNKAMLSLPHPLNTPPPPTLAAPRIISGQILKCKTKSTRTQAEHPGERFKH